MILAIFVVISALLATWVSYWSTNLFRSLSNRASRIACLVSPGLLAITAGIVTGAYLGASGAEIQLSDHPARYEIAATILAITTLLIVPTLLLAFVVGRLGRAFTPHK